MKNKKLQTLVITTKCFLKADLLKRGSCSLCLATTALYLIIFISAVHILTIVLNPTDERICNHTEIVHSKLFLLK